MIERLVRAIRADDARPAGSEARGTRRTDGREERDGREGDEEGHGRDVDDDDDGVVEDAFLEPDERILVLLSECGGRLWQQDVVERTDYSAARVSELLGEMEADGRINRYWKDGEKVVSFPEFGPE